MGAFSFETIDLSKLYEAWENYYKAKKLGYKKILKLTHAKVKARKAPPNMNINKLVRIID